MKQTYNTERPKIITRPPGPNARHWIERSAKCQALKAQPRFPALVISRAKGVYVTDIDDNIYLDFTAQIGSIGHSHSKVFAAVIEKMKETGLCANIGVTDKDRVILAEKLQEITRGWLSDVRVAYCNTGSDAAEFSMQIARAYTHRPGIMAFQGSYHGGSLAALSITMDRSVIKRGVRPLISDLAYTPFAYCYRCPFRLESPDCGLACVDYLRYVLDTVIHPDDIAALFLEPIQVHGGIIVPPDGFLNKVARIFQEHGILVVDDEVVTALGRTGSMFALRHWAVEPDLVFLAKPFAAGLSLGCIMGREEIMRFFRSAGSYAGNPIYCAAASSFIDLLSQEKLIENASRVGQYMIKRLVELQEKCPLIGDVRGKGLLIGVELVKDHKTKEPATKETAEVITMASQKGLLVLPAGTYEHVLRITPPLTLGIDQAEQGIEILEQSIKAVCPSNEAD